VPERSLGAGGFGAVYLAHHVEHPELKRAVKWLEASDSESAARFEREAELLARVRHPGVVRVHEVGRLPGGFYLVLDLVAGSSLRALLRQSPAGLPLERACELAVGVARAVGAAHALGICHRDLKPENVLVDEHGVPRVIDFGLALSQDVDRLTKSAVMLGTAGYMAPEQLDGRRESQGPPSDVFSLGVVFYEMLTGRPPFAAGGHIAILRAMVERKYERATKVRAGLPEWVDEVVGRALARSPERRFPDGEAFARAIDERLLKGSQEATARIGRRRIGVLALLLVAAAATGWAIASRFEKTHTERAALSSLADEMRSAPLDSINEGRLAEWKTRRDATADWLTDERKAVDRELERLERCLAVRREDSAQRLEVAFALLADEGELANRPGGQRVLDQALAVLLPVYDRDADVRRKVDALARTRALAATLPRRIAKSEFERAVGEPNQAKRAQLLERARTTDREAFVAAAKNWANHPDAPRGEPLDELISVASDVERATSSTAAHDPCLHRLVELLDGSYSREKGSNPIAVLRVRHEIAVLDPTHGSPLWYPGFVLRLATEQLPGREPPLSSDDSALVLVELVAEDALWVLSLGQITNYVEELDHARFATKDEGEVLRAILCHHQLEFPYSLPVSKKIAIEHAVVEPRLEPVFRSFSRRLRLVRDDEGHWMPTEDQAAAPRPTADTDDLVGAAFACAIRLGMNIEPTRERELAQILSWTELAYGNEVARVERIRAALRDAPDDPDLKASLTLALVRAASVREEHSRIGLVAHEFDEDKPHTIEQRRRLWTMCEPYVQALREAIAICPEETFRSLLLKVRLTTAFSPRTGIDDPLRFLEADAALEKDERWSRALESPTTQHPTIVADIVLECYYRAIADLELDPPRLDDAERMIERAGRVQGEDANSDNFEQYRIFKRSYDALRAALEKR
jgi:hypothetical protein